MKKLVVGPLAFVAFAWGTSAAMAEEAATVDTLLAQGYSVVGAITSQIGPGVFLEKGPNLMLCFISETPSSVAVTTRYCKPVH